MPDNQVNDGSFWANLPPPIPSVTISQSADGSSPVLTIKPWFYRSQFQPGAQVYIYGSTDPYNPAVPPKFPGSTYLLATIPIQLGSAIQFQAAPIYFHGYFFVRVLNSGSFSAVSQPYSLNALGINETVSKILPPEIAHANLVQVPYLLNGVLFSDITIQYQLPPILQLGPDVLSEFAGVQVWMQNYFGNNPPYNHSPSYTYGQLFQWNGVALPSGVQSVQITNQGTGYGSAPTVIATNAAGDTTGFGATFKAYNTAGGIVYFIAVTSPGWGYTKPPVLTFSGGGGVNLAATCTLNQTFQTCKFTLMCDYQTTAGLPGYFTTPHNVWVYLIPVNSTAFHHSQADVIASAFNPTAFPAPPIFQFKLTNGIDGMTYISL